MVYTMHSYILHMIPPTLSVGMFLKLIVSCRMQKIIPGCGPILAQCTKIEKKEEERNKKEKERRGKREKRKQKDSKKKWKERRRRRRKKRLPLCLISEPMWLPGFAPFFNSGSPLWFNLGLAVISDLNQYYIYTWYLFETFFMSTHFCHLKNDFESMLKKNPNKENNIFLLLNAKKCFQIELNLTVVTNINHLKVIIILMTCLNSDFCKLFNRLVCELI